MKRKDLAISGLLLMIGLAVGLCYLPPEGRVVAVGALVIIFGGFF